MKQVKLLVSFVFIDIGLYKSVEVKGIWYQQAIASNGSMCTTEPYVDADDGDFIITISRKLKDGSVMGMDINVNHIKNTIGSAMGLTLHINGNQAVSGYSFMMTKKGIVTMHMDEKEITKDYSQSDSPLNKLYKKVMKNKDSYFITKINGEDYMVFPIELNNGWYYITVTSFDDLNRIFLNFIIVIIIGTAFVLIFATVYCIIINKANKEAGKLTERLAQALEDAKVDQLTKLYNRVAYDLRLDALKIGMGTESDIPFAILLMDINNLKYVNDNLGHQKGDVYILNCCEAMKAVFGKDIYRLGGDEFAVILTAEQYDQREQLYEKMLQYGQEALNHPIQEDNVNIAIGMGVHKKGVCESIATIVNMADSSMYKNKEELKRARQKRQENVE